MAMNWAKDYAPVVYEWFNQGVEAIPSLIPVLYDVRTSRNASERALGVGGVPVDQWSIYKETGEKPHVDVDRGYHATFSHDEYVVRYALEKKHIRDDSMGLVQEGLRELGISAAQVRETHAASLFNNAFSSSYTGPDSVSLCNAAHPVGPDNTGTTRDNTGTEAFSYEAIKNARAAMRAWNDGQGNPLMAMGKLALLPVELEDKAIETLESRGMPGTANNDASATRAIQYQVWDYLTDADNWFLLDPLRTRRFLRWYNREPLTVMIVEETTTSIVYEFHMRYSYGWTHWSFVYGNAVS